MPLAAKALGVTIEQLNEMVRRGEVASKDFLPKFAKELRKSVKDTGALQAGLKSVTAAQGRMNATFQLLVKEIFDSGLKEFAVDTFNGISTVIKDLTPTFKLLGMVIGGVTAAVFGLISGIDTLLKMLGFESGGAGFVVKLLIALMIGKLIPTLTLTGATGTAAFGSIATSAGFAATATGLLTRALLVAKAAARGLLAALGPIGLLFLGGSLVFDLFSGSSNGSTGASRATQQASTRTNSVASLGRPSISEVNLSFDITESNNPLETRLMIREELNNALQDPIGSIA